MLKSLEQIKRVKAGELSILKTESWLKHLWLNENKDNTNLEYVKKIEEKQNLDVLNYVEKTLSILDSNKVLNEREKNIVEKVLCWSEVAKCGNLSQRKIWKDKEYPLAIHNYGSSIIYLEEDKDVVDSSIIAKLIMTHGLIGQYLRGESKLNNNIIIYDMLEKENISKKSLFNILIVLNKCIIQVISLDLYCSLDDKIENVIESILDNKIEEYGYGKRLELLRSVAISNGENFKKSFQECLNDELLLILTLSDIFRNNLWYVESATSEFTLKELLKIFVLIQKKLDEHKDCYDISFFNLMNNLYYDYKDNKTINVYKKRIIEKYLKEVSLDGNLKDNEHITPTFEEVDNILFFDFKLSPIAEKLVEFCVTAENEGTLYDRAIIMLYDLFDFRRDEYDRFHNEDTYLENMNSSIHHKAQLVDYVVGKNVLDVGPGGGALLDLLEETFPNKNILGIDVSSNVIETLNKKKYLENKNWIVKEGNALALENTFKQSEIDTIILSSIVHELFSYIPFNNKKFNYDTLKTAFNSMLSILPIGGRIIIRDGVMTANDNETRIIKFKNNADINVLNEYCRLFKGRPITYTLLNENTVQMAVNDAMEFLYTYTWGDESFPHEVQEQFGYFTPKEYQDFFFELAKDSVKVVECKHFLQTGYAEHLESKIEFFDQDFNVTSLPDSTIILVVEKIK